VVCMPPRKQGQEESSQHSTRHEQLCNCVILNYTASPCHIHPCLGT
jgi:hypothetical protein